MISCPRRAPGLSGVWSIGMYSFLPVRHDTLGPIGFGSGTVGEGLLFQSGGYVPSYCILYSASQAWVG